MFGALLRKERLRAGFASPRALAEEMVRRYQISITDRSIYRYESGQALPSAEFFLIALVVLSPRLLIDSLVTVYGFHFVPAARRLSPPAIGTASTGYQQLALFDATEYGSAD
jgi:hypothetical protein